MVLRCKSKAARGPDFMNFLVIPGPNTIRNTFVRDIRDRKEEIFLFGQDCGEPYFRFPKFGVELISRLHQVGDILTLRLSNPDFLRSCVSLSLQLLNKGLTRLS